MASERQRRRDEAARAKGYKNYTDQRNAQAKEQGYKNYSEQRKARRTGIGRKGKDAPAQRAPVRPVSRPRAEVYLPPPARPFHDGLTVPRSRFQDLTAKLRTTEADITHAQNKTKSDPKQAERYRRQLQDSLKRSVIASENYYQTQFDDIYLEAFRKASGDPNAVPSDKQLRELNRLKKQGREDVQKAAIGADRSAKNVLPKIGELASKKPPLRDKSGKAIGKQAKPEKIPGRRKGEREVDTYIRRNGVRAVTYSNGAKMPFQAYTEMSVRTLATRAQNNGIVEGAILAGVQTFEISDGPDCGLTNHDDGQKANGMKVDAETALAYPLAHPNCVRTFTPKPGEKPDRGFKEKFFGLAKDIAKGSAISTTVATAQNVNQIYNLTDRLQEHARRAIPNASEFAAKIDLLIRGGRIENVVDIKTGKPKRFGMRAIADDITTYMDDFAAGRQLPAHVYQALGLSQFAPRKIVGDKFEHWNEWYHNGLQGTLSAVGEFATSTIDDLQNIWADKWLDALEGKSEGRHIRLTAPAIAGRGIKRLTTPRIALRFKRAKLSLTQGKNGRINHLSLNPNGLLRAGFAQDALGHIIPTFRLVPRGPIRVMTRVNRSIGRLDEEGFRRGAGAITSLTTEVRIITPRAAVLGINKLIGLPSNAGVLKYLGYLDINFGVSLNVNLRQLGLEKLTDIRKLRLSDWKKIRRQTVTTAAGEVIDHPGVRVVSLAADFRLAGHSVFDMARTFRIKWEDAVKLWNLSTLELLARNKKAEIIAMRRRKRLRMMRGATPTDLDNWAPYLERPLGPDGLEIPWDAQEGFLEWPELPDRVGYKVAANQALSFSEQEIYEEVLEKQQEFIRNNFGFYLDDARAKMILPPTEPPDWAWVQSHTTLEEAEEAFAKAKKAFEEAPHMFAHLTDQVDIDLEIAELAETLMMHAAQKKVLEEFKKTSGVFLKSQLGQWAAAALAYSRSSYTVNKVLLRRIEDIVTIGGERGLKRAKTMVKNIDEIHRNSTTKGPMVIYRGMAADEDFIDRLKEGKVLSDFGYVSGSFDPRMAENFTEWQATGDRQIPVFFQIELPEGTPAFVMHFPKVDSLLGNEAEVILPRGGRFYIHTVIETGDENNRSLLVRARFFHTSFPPPPRSQKPPGKPKLKVVPRERTPNQNERVRPAPRPDNES